MGGTTEVALYPAYDQGNLFRRYLYGTGIVTMTDKSAEVSTGVLQMANLDEIHSVIIEFL